MHFNFKKVIASSLATAMLITNISINSLSNVSASLITNTQITSPNKVCPTHGKCGESADWLLNSDGVLIISGAGGMSAYADDQSLDWGWRYLGYNINEIVVEDDITGFNKSSSAISPFALSLCPMVSNIILPPSLTKLDYILAYPDSMSMNLNNIYLYSKDISDSNFSQFEYNSTNSNLWSQRKVIWHVYKNSVTEASLRENLSLKDDQIEYIPDDEQMTLIDNKTPSEFEQVTDTSGPASLTSKWEWNETNKTLTFSGKGPISIADNYKQYAEKTEHIVIEEGITHLSANTGIKTVSASGATSYYCGSFTGFNSLKDVKLPETLQVICDSTFCGDENLEEINFPENLKAIGESAFSNCSKLKYINLNEGMIIGGSAFTMCTSLKEVTIPKNVTFEGTTFGGAGMVRAHSTFAYCTGLEKVVIEDGSLLKDTWDKVYTQNGIPEAFCTGCSSLKTVTIKGNIDYISSNAFNNCILLTDIYFYNTSLSTIISKDADYNYNKISIDTSHNPTFHVIKGSQTEETLRNAGYLNDENTVYLTDFTALDAKIKEADNLDTSKYTDDSVNALKSAIESGKTVLNNENATQEQVDSALTAIENAIKNLKSKVSPTIPTGNAPIVTTTRSPEVVKKDKTTAENLMKQAKITKLTVKSKSKKKINVTWKKVKTAVGYQVQVSKKSNFKKRILNKFTTKKKLTINKKIKSGKTYFVRVRAYATYKDAFGKPQKVYSKWNKKLRKVKVK